MIITYLENSYNQVSSLGVYPSHRSFETEMAAVQPMSYNKRKVLYPVPSPFEGTRRLMRKRPCHGRAYPYRPHLYPNKSFKYTVAVPRPSDICIYFSQMPPPREEKGLALLGSDSITKKSQRSLFQPILACNWDDDTRPREELNH